MRESREIKWRRKLRKKVVRENREKVVRGSDEKSNERK